MSDTLPAALRAVSDGPVRLHTALQRAARRLRSAAHTGAAPVGTALPPLLLDGGLGLLFSERLRALLITAAAPPAVEERTSTTPHWAAQPGARAALQLAPFVGSAAPPPHVASVPPVLPPPSSFANPVSAPRGGGPGAAPASFNNTVTPHGLSGAALLRDRISRALAAPSIEQRPEAFSLGAQGGSAPALAPTSPPATDAHGSHAPAMGQPMTPAETAAALRAFAEGKPIAGRTSAEDAQQTMNFMSSAEAPAAGDPPVAYGAGSRSTLVPNAHFSSQGFAFADGEATAALTPDALADSLATILRHQARAYGIEMP